MYACGVFIFNHIFSDKTKAFTVSSVMLHFEYMASNLDYILDFYYCHALYGKH